MRKNEKGHNPSETVVVVPAAGAGTRMEEGKAKQFLYLGDRPLLAATLEPFQNCRAVDAIILVVPPGDEEYCLNEIVKEFKIDKVKKVVPGGKRRQDSVMAGIEATKGKYELVMIHDGVRTFIDVNLIESVIKGAITHRAVITALPAKETVKEATGQGEVIQTYDRRRVWLVQTPQIFRYEDIRAAHQKALNGGWEEATEDSLLVERLGIPVKIIKGSEKNIKVTTPFDMEMARFFLGRVD